MKMIPIAVLIAAVYFLFEGTRSLLTKDPSKRKTPKPAAIVMLIAGIAFLLIGIFFSQFLKLVLG